MRRAVLALLAILPACVGLDHTYRNTIGLDDASTNVEAFLWPHPAPVCARPPARPQRDVPAGVVAPDRLPAAGTLVNTDVDDTLIARGWDRGRYPQGSLYPGVLELLLAEGGAPGSRSLTALTARPTAGATQESLRVWFRGELSDEAAAADVEVSTGEIGNVLDSLGMGLVKAEKLLAERKAHPRARIVFNGDSGQGDWIAALIMRDLERSPALSYATIHDVRAWSPGHARALLLDLDGSERLARIYRGALGSAADQGLRRIHADVAAALRGPHGRLDGAFLRSRGIFLHRSYAALALDLEEAGLVRPDDTDRVLAAACSSLCFAPPNAFGFDEGEREALRRRLAQRDTRHRTPAGCVNVRPDAARP